MNVRLWSRPAALLRVETIEQIFLHDVEVLKHRAFGFGGIALLDGLENLLVPAPRHFMARGADRLHFRVVEQLPVERQSKKYTSAGLVDLGEGGVMSRLGECVVKHAVGVASGRVARDLRLDRALQRVDIVRRGA